MAAQLDDRIAALPGAPGLTAALEGLAPAYLVGGAVRDLLLGAPAVDLDLVVEGDAAAVARALAERLGREAVVHERFGTATVRGAEADVDLARARTESYPRPGALPEVRPAATIEEDLGRRDFTVNAMAAALSGERRGALIDPHGGSADLARRLVRVLHDRSFEDDPTRLLRALRYAARLDFQLDGHTDELARAAAASGALATVSGRRLGDELLDLLREPAAPAAVEGMGDLGIDRAMHPALRADPDLVAGAQLGATETGADPALAGLAAICLPGAADDALAGWIGSLGLTAQARDAVLHAARRASALATELRAAPSPSRLHALLRDEPPEALALALALGAPGEPVLRYLSDLRGVRLAITGDDLVAAGVPPSPAIGAALEAVRARVLDGELAPDRNAQLAAALDHAGGQR